MAAQTRLGGAAGIVAMASLVVGFLLPGSPPKADDSVQAITSFLVDKRSSLLAGDFLIGLGSVLLLVWLSALRSRLERDADEGEGVLPGAAFAAGAVAAGLNLAGAAVSAATVFQAAGLRDTTLNRALFDMSTDLFTVAGFAIALVLVAFSVSAARGRARSLPSWAPVAGGVAAALQLVSCVAIFARSGFLASGGAFGFVAFASAVGWVVAVSVVLLRDRQGGVVAGS